jgi:hypothetical protein
MKATTTNHRSSKMPSSLVKGRGTFSIIKAVLTLFVMFTTPSGVFAQVSGAWDSFTGNGTPGNNNYGNGVIRLISDVNTGCAAGAVHETSSTYDPNGGTTFSKCYQVFFGCPGNDNINSDANGDGMAFSFWKNSATYNINNGLACGGGLGYMGSASDGKMITIEFDTYSSAFDGTYGGGTTGFNDEISVHFNGDANTSGILPGGTVNAGNLEDGLEHTICITYTPGTRVLAVTIDGVSKLSIDLGATYNFQTYFGAGGLNQTWSSGKFGATNPTTVNDGNGTTITSQLGGVPLCPAAVDITSPTSGTTFSGCPVAPITITATATPPAGNTVSYVEFFVDGVSIGTDNTTPHSIVWGSPTNGSHAITAVGHFSASSNITSAATNITVGGTNVINATGTAPTIDGSGADAIWASYSSFAMNQAEGGVAAPDLDATYKIMYDATYLYVLVDVDDNNLNNDGQTGADYWKEDGIEIYIDIGNDKVGCCSYGANDYQYAYMWNNTGLLKENKHNSTGGVGFAQTTKAGNLGYVMEFRIPWSTLGGTPTPGTAMGFDVKINDDDHNDDGNNPDRNSQLAWNDGTFGLWQDPSKFGTLTFSSCNPLPVSLLTFTGEKGNGTVVLNWSTIVEINNQQFIIERSVNGSDWEAIGEVAGAGNSNNIHEYSYIDYSVAASVVYYRIKQVDDDGANSYSTIVTIKSAGAGIHVMPNPFTDALTIENDVAGLLDISIYDVLGKLLFNASKENSEGSVTIYPELTSGAYVMVVRTDVSVEQHRIIKK